MNGVTPCISFVPVYWSQSFYSYRGTKNDTNLRFRIGSPTLGLVERLGWKKWYKFNLSDWQNFVKRFQREELVGENLRSSVEIYEMINSTRLLKKPITFNIMSINIIYSQLDTIQSNFIMPVRQIKAWIKFC